MNYMKLAPITAMLAISSLHALTESRIDEKKPISVTFSRSSHNRISIEGGSVEKVFGDRAIFSPVLDGATGNAFITLLRDIGEQPKTLTVVTSSGFIQDLLVSSSEGSSEQLILKEEEDLDESLPEKGDLHATAAATVDLLNKILEGKTPFGYGERALQKEDKLELPKPLKAQPVRAFEGPFETIVAYSIQNTGKDTIEITADSLKKEKISWVFLNAQELKNRAQALCLIAYPKDRE